MIIGVLKEAQEGENRVAATPQTVKDLIKGGFEVHVQSNTGTPSFISDEEYQNLGGTSSIKLEYSICIDCTTTLDEFL